MHTTARTVTALTLAASLAVGGTALATTSLPTASDSPIDGRAAAVPKVVWDGCRPAVPDRARCGHITVPADPRRPTLGKQRVGFELYRRTDTSKPSLGTVMAQEGGPGYPSTGSRSYYLPLFRPLLDRRDLLLVDQRGTGTSDPIRCAALQRGERPYIDAVGACGRQLGARADTYATAYAANDSAALLDALGIDKVDLYGDSYGTFFAQTFAVRHPDRVRTLTLDASYPISGNDPWWRDTNRAIQDALTRVCDRDAYCSQLNGSAVGRMRAAGQQLHTDPVVGRAPNAAGRSKKVRLDGVNLALLTAYATYGTSIYRELDSAVRAFRAGYQRPLLRMVAENISKSYAGGNPVDYSAGQYIAVICSDYPQLWDVSLPPGPQRRQQYRDAVADVTATDSTGFDPFRADDWIKSGWVEPKTCINWPSPTKPLPPEPSGVPYPTMPTLVLSGDLDSVTSPEGGQDVASRFPNSTFVSVPNVGHVTAMGDKQGCAAGIVQRFVRTGGSTGDTSCVDADYAPVRAVPKFVRTSKGLGLLGWTSYGQISKADLSVIAGALFAAADPLTRWWVNYSGSGVGLAGGTFSYRRADGAVRFTLDDLAFVRDVSVTGVLTWDRSNGQVRAELAVDGPRRHDGRLRMRWNDWRTDAQARVRGSIGGTPVDVTTRAP
jgi:pimeloyl-ACP methyl ester carboxylesterase